MKPREQALISRLETLPPVIVLGISMLVGVLLNLGSAIAHVNAVSFDAKRLGYWYEINWSVNYVFIIPLALYFCASAMNSMRQVVSSLGRHEMIVTSSGKSVSTQDLVASWHQSANRGLKIATLLAPLALLASWIEWGNNFFYTGTPLRSTTNPNGLLAGWNLAPLVGRTTPLDARVFGFLAYTCQGLVAASYIGFVILVISFTAWIYRYTTDDTREELIPDCRSDDTRRGFERFEPFVENLLMASIFFFFVFFLIRLDNAYVESSINSTTEFLYKYIWTAGLTDFPSGWIPGSIADDLAYPFVMAGTAMAITVVIAFSVPSLIVRKAAIGSRDRAEDQVEQLNLVAHFGMARDAIVTRLRSMTVWPLKYPAPAQLLLILGLAVVCYVWFQLTLALAGVIIYRGIREFLKISQPQSRQT